LAPAQVRKGPVRDALRDREIDRAKNLSSKMKVQTGYIGNKLDREHG